LSILVRDTEEVIKLQTSITKTGKSLSAKEIFTETTFKNKITLWSYIRTGKSTTEKNISLSLICV
jgi:hypothetical protein